VGVLTFSVHDADQDADGLVAAGDHVVPGDLVQSVVARLLEQAVDDGLRVVHLLAFVHRVADDAVVFLVDALVRPREDGGRHRPELFQIQRPRVQSRGFDARTGLLGEEDVSRQGVHGRCRCRRRGHDVWTVGDVLRV